LPEIESINYVSSAQALADFSAKHAGNALITESLGQLTDNPLPATLQVKAKQLNQYPKIADELNKPEYQAYVDKVNFEDNRSVIERLVQDSEYNQSAWASAWLWSSPASPYLLFSTQSA
jgi:cell division protein FtsX